jgi:hypothetical protein
LAELLVVIAIIGILTSMALMTLYGVREDARDKRTRAIITKINEHVMRHWESYRTRAIPVRIPAGTDPRTAAALRLNAVRELMRMELPDRLTDLRLRDPSAAWAWVNPPVPVATAATYYAQTPVWLTSPPSLWLTYQRRIATNAALGKTWTTQHEHAECLYLILSAMRDLDGTALDSFQEEEIGDTDDDGMPEILDAWGRPIYFLRWAPGFVSDLQDTEKRFFGDAKAYPADPFDPVRVDPRWDNNDNSAGSRLDDPFALYPLIYSAGRDKRYGVVRKDYDPTTTPPTDVELTYYDTHRSPYDSAVPNTTIYPPLAAMPFPPWPTAIWPSRPMNDPYVILPTSGDYIGRKFINGDGDDDITSHLIQVQ